MIRERVSMRLLREARHRRWSYRIVARRAYLLQSGGCTSTMIKAIMHRGMARGLAQYYDG